MTARSYAKPAALPSRRALRLHRAGRDHAAMNDFPAARGPRRGLLLAAIVACAQVGAGAPTPKPPRNDVPYLAQVRARMQLARDGAPPAATPAVAAPRSAGFDARLLPLVTGEGAIGDRYGWSLARAGDVLLVGVPFDTLVAPGVRGGVTAGAVAAYRRLGAGWTREATLAPADIAVGDLQGYSVAMSGDLAVVGAPLATRAAGQFSGLAFVYQRSGTAWTEVARLELAAPAADDRFGQSVAIDGTRILVGAPGRDPGGIGDAGVVGAFERIAGTWQATQTLLAATPTAGARLGSAVAVAGDVAAVGAPFTSAPGAPEQGAVQVYVRNGANWEPAQALAPSTALAHYGAAVLLDPARLVAAAPDDTLGGAAARGRVWVYPRNGAMLGTPYLLTPPPAVPGSGFGASLASDGARLLVGMPDAYNSQGAAFVHDDGGAGPALVATLALDDGGNTELLGYSVALDGTQALLGAPLDNVAPNRAQGSVRVYDGAAAWAALPSMNTGDGAQNEVSGFAVALHGARAAVGSYLDDPDTDLDDAGSTSVWVQGAAGWQREARLVPAGAESEDRSGIAVALRDDVLAVGAYFDIVGPNFNQGSVAIYTRGAGGWAQTAQLIAPNGLRDDFLGFALAYDGDTLLVGAPGDDAAGVDAGAAYVFRRNGGAWLLEARLFDPATPPEAFAGIAVALRGDLAVVGAPDADNGAAILQGEVQVWRRGAQGWSLVQTLRAADGAAFDFLGGAVATDGQRILAGAPGVSDATVEGHGAVYEFTRTGDGSFVAAGRLPGPPPEAGAGYGISVALADDRALVGASGATDGGLAQAGQAWLLRRGAAGWSLAKPLLPADPSEFAFYGRSVAIDGARLAVGAPERAGVNVFEGAVDLWDDDDRILADGFD